MQFENLPSSISYESVKIPHIELNTAFKPFQSQLSDERLLEDQNLHSVLRRPIYDILLQLKAEANLETNQNAELISAVEDNDRQFGVYEGGLKTWEGALDLAGLVKGLDLESQSGDWHIVELGAGSAIPSLVALKKLLAVEFDADLTAVRRRCHFTLSDYNDEVLRLSTFANVLLISKHELDRRQKQAVLSTLSSEGSIDVDEDLIRDCHKLWRQEGLSFSFISGPWGKDFQALITTSMPQRSTNVLILAAETIYDLKSLPAFTDTLMNILRAHGESSRAWIAAKTLYFGVGGGVDAFVQEVNSRGGAIRQIMSIKQGVSRVVLEVTCPETVPTILHT